MSQVMAHKLVKRVSCNRETAIKELTRGYELVKQLQSKIESSDHRVDDAANLSDGVLQTLTVALSLVKQSSISPADRKTGQGVKRSTAVDQRHRFQKRGRKEMNSWTMITPAPYLDDYQWRKYGQKKIQNAKHPRTYYRCTHSSDQGCPATKQVQQQNEHGESPMYLVICNNQHTCITTTKIPTPEFILESPRHDESGFWTFEPKRSNPRFTNVIKEDQLIPPHFTSTTTPKEMSGTEEDDILARSTNPTMTSSSTRGIAEEVFFTTTPVDMDGCLLSPYHISDSYGFEFDDELESLINSIM